MGGISFSFRKGPIFLEEDGARVASVHSISRAQKFTAVVWDLTACISLVGIGALTWAYCILEPFSNDHWYLMEYYTWPYFLMVIILFNVSIIWPCFKAYMLRRHRYTLSGMFSTAEDILMIASLVYYPTVCVCRLKDRWDQPLAWSWEYMVVVGLTCAYLVALFRLVLLTIRVITFIVNMNNGRPPSPAGQWLYSKGYSTSIAIYFISGCLSSIGFSMMLFAYAFLINFASGYYRWDGNIWAAHSVAGFDALTIMLFAAPSWFLANLISMILRNQTLSHRKAAIYNLSFSTAVISLSIYCYISLEYLNKACSSYIWNSQCEWIWESTKPRHMAAIILALIVGLIHFSLVLNGLYHRIQAARDKNRINVLLHQLDNSEFGGLGPLHSHFWTDKEITSIFRISTTGDVARGYIISILCEIHNEDTKAYKQVPTPLLRFQAAVERKIRGILDGVTWGDFELAVLYEALENAEATELKMNGEGEYDSGDVYDTNSNVDLPSLSNETG